MFVVRLQSKCWNDVTFGNFDPYAAEKIYSRKINAEAVQPDKKVSNLNTCLFSGGVVVFIGGEAFQKVGIRKEG